MERPIVLSIAGFDPTSGAGVSSDLKTFEHFNVYGYGVLTANTIQNCDQFLEANWVPVGTLLKQLDLVLAEAIPKVVKIGIVENLEVLNAILKKLQEKAPQAYIIWDPIIRSSSGFEIHNNLSKDLLVEVLSSINLLTPNIPEFDFLERITDPRTLCDVYLKGGHGTDMQEVQDALFMNNQQTKVFSSPKIDAIKHGTGCVLSSVITAEVAKEKPLIEACQTSFDYLKTFISSNSGELGYHL